MHTSFTLMPHAVCWRQDPALIWTMVVTNAITFLAYTAICLTLFYLAARTKRVIAKDWAYFVVGFALFIVACGSTHLLEVITTWNPIFWVDAWTNVVTAALSGYVAVQFFRRAQEIGFGINDYAGRLANTETEKARMRESLLAAQKLEDWSRLSMVMSHEIANPLESIQNLLYLVKTDPDASEAIKDYSEKAAEEAMRVLTIARSTLGFFRDGAEPENVDLSTVMESVRFVLESVLRERGVRLQVSVTGDVTVAALPGEVRQVMLNLVRNAVEASHVVGSSVNVGLHGSEDSVEICVEDHGVGIPGELLPTLFHFGVTTKGSSGNGMGLWTVRHIVMRHGGSIGVESTPGKGTEFKVQWPRKYVVQDASTAPKVPLAMLAGEAAGEIFSS